MIRLRQLALLLALLAVVALFIWALTRGDVW